MGLPWFVAATVLSITHVNSLKMETETSAPGETPKFLGVREQRVTGLMIFMMIGLSIFLTPVLAYIPMPVLYGVFLYMGVSSLKGQTSAFSKFLMVFEMKRRPVVTLIVRFDVWRSVSGQSFCMFANAVEVDVFGRK